MGVLHTTDTDISIYPFILEGLHSIRQNGNERRLLLVEQKRWEGTATKLTIRCFLIGLGLAPTTPALALIIAFGVLFVAEFNPTPFPWVFPLPIPPPIPFTIAPVPLYPVPLPLPISSLSLFFPLCIPPAPIPAPDVPFPGCALVGVANLTGVPALAEGTCTGGKAGFAPEEFVDPGRGTVEPGLCIVDVGRGTADPGRGTADPGLGTVDPGLGVPVLVRGVSAIWGRTDVTDVGIGA